MVRYTTPTLPCTIHALIGADAQIYATISQRGGVSITKEIPVEDLSMSTSRKETYVYITLDQNDTAELNPNSPLMVQFNWVYQDGTRGASRCAKITVFDNLLRSVVNYKNEDAG